MKKTRYWLTISLLSLAVLIAFSEATVRLAGYAPRAWVRASAEHGIYRPDPLAGWVHKPGAYVLPPFGPGENDVRMTILPDGSRATGPAGEAARDELVLVGGSFTQGKAISDHETFAWKLQERFPGRKILNHGVAGYGTYQSLLALERVLPGLTSPARVLYGFYGHHEHRNVAPAYWLADMTGHSRLDVGFVPYATLDTAGHLVRHRPERHIALPLREYLALSAFAEILYMKVSDGIGGNDRLLQARGVTEALLLEMKALSAAHGAEFGVILLNAKPDVLRHYRAFLPEHGIQVIDCHHGLTPDMIVTGDGHPNGALNSVWADCIGAELAKVTPQ